MVYICSKSRPYINIYIRCICTYCIYTYLAFIPLAALVVLIFPVLLLGAPWEGSHPKSQVEYISNDKRVDSGFANPNIVPITQPSVVTQTAPPPPPNSKNFAYSPMTQSWTTIAPGDPLPNNDTLVWNQSNDKWLTR